MQGHYKQNHIVSVDVNRGTILTYFNPTLIQLRLISH